MFRWFESRLDPFPDCPPEMPPPGFTRFVWHYLRPSLGLVCIISLCSALIAVSEVLIYSSLGALVDWLAQESRQDFFTRNGGVVFGVLALLVIGKPALHGLFELVFHQSFVGNFAMRIRWLAHRYLLEQSLSFFQNDMAGRIGTTLMQTAFALRDAIIKLFNMFVYFFVYIASTVFFMAFVDVRLMIPLCLWFCVYVGTLVYFVPRMGAMSQSAADTRARMTGCVIDSYTNIATVKLFAHSKAEADYARASMDPFMASIYKQLRLVSVFNTLMYLQNSIMLAGLAALSILLWQGEGISTGSIAVALALALRLQGLSHWISSETAALFEVFGTIRDGATLLARPLSVRDQPSAKALPPVKGEIRFEDVHFGYGTAKNALDGLNLHIKPGEKVGIIGRSGAGKSTMVALLLRLHDVAGGAIRIDGQNIAEVTQESLRAEIAVVTQDTALLHRSVSENIRYGNPDAGEARVIAAAKAAHAHDFILDLEDAKGRKGYDAQVGERGVKLSGGQRQRIAIARVFLKNAPILVLDEATSALDSEVEAAIQESLDLLVAGKTVIAIAHRLSTIAAMDRLIVMDQGRVIEEGTHDTLIAQGGVYARLWAHQSGGFIAQD
jgi:ATP-binding cassette, subfamily B, multidrug efflux pump